MVKERIEEEVDTGSFASDNVKLFESQITKDLGGDIIGEICDPKGYGAGSFKLDMALTQSFPQGFVHEIFAENAVGKTTLALEVLGQAQQKGCRVCYLDLEGTLNQSLIKSIRTLDVTKKDNKGQPLWMYKEGLLKDKNGEINIITGEQALKFVRDYVAIFRNAYIVVDSVDTIIPENILEGKDIGDATMGSLAKLLSDALRRIHGHCKKNNNTVIFINQVRATMAMYGAKETTPGGKAIPFYSVQRLKLSKTGKDGNVVDDNGTIVGHRVKVSIIKNKLPTTQNDPEFTIMYGRGIDRETELIELGIMCGIIKPWVDDKGNEMKRFIDILGNKVPATEKYAAASRYLYENPTICQQLEAKVRESYGI